MSAGGLASYTKGPLMVSRSWVPMATKDRFLEETKQTKWFKVKVVKAKWSKGKVV